MNLRQFNFLILSTDGRFRTMANMSLDNEYKFELAKTGLFSHNNLIKCIGCRTILDKINAKQIKRHTYSDYCISSTNALMFNESMRKSFTSFKNLGVSLHHNPWSLTCWLVAVSIILAKPAIYAVPDAI